MARIGWVVAERIGGHRAHYTHCEAESAKMTDYVVTGLVKHRAELAGEIERAHEGLRKTVLELESLDATIVQIALEF